jgi:hypothetical protein
MFVDGSNKQLLAGIRQAQFRPQFSLICQAVLVGHAFPAALRKRSP